GGRVPVRVLHAGAAALGVGPARAHREAVAHGDPHRHGGQPLPLRRLREDRARDPARLWTRNRGLMAGPRLVKTQVEMEGRYEGRWVLVEEEGPPPMAGKDELAVVGRPARRVTGPKRVSGSAKFVSDISLPGMLHAGVLRCPHAHATVELDVDAARAMPGV